MSFDLAVWEDVPPFAGLSADDAYAVLVERLEDDDAVAEPATPVIAGFVEALLARWPDLDDEAGEDSPWATGSLAGEGFGPCIYFAMTWSQGPGLAGDIAAIARRHGLVCYDPQSERVLT